MNCSITSLDLRAKRINIIKEIGDTMYFTLTFTDNAGDPIDMSGISSASFVMNNTEAGSLGSGIAVVGDDSNVMQIFIQVQNETKGRYDYKLTVTYADNMVKTIIDGKIIIE